MHVLETVGAHVGVDLCRTHVGMTEQLLNRPQIGPTVEEVGGEGVPERVRVHGRRGTAVEDAPDVARGERIAPTVDEERRLRIAGVDELRS